MRIPVLDMKNHVTGNIIRHQGTVNSSVLRAAETYRPAVSLNGPGILICHDHPAATRRTCPKIARN